MSDTSIPPWYKQFWPWFLLGLLFSSILFSTGFAIMSIKSYDGMVVQEDYYEHGKAINMVLAKQERARELNLSADLRIDPLTSDIVIDLAGDARPDKLYLDLIFPTEDDRDQSFVLDTCAKAAISLRGRIICATAGTYRFSPCKAMTPSGA